MNSQKSRVVGFLSPVIASCFIVAAPGCDSRGENEREFLNSAPAGNAPENPDEKVSERRSRLMNKSKLEVNIEKKAQAKSSRR